MASPLPTTGQPDSPSATVAATSAATSAASGKHGKAKMPMLHTPMSASYPSEIQTPLSATPTLGRRGDDLSFGKSTPISPPAAYREFLKAHSPAIPSPPSTCASLSREHSFGSVVAADKIDGQEPNGEAKVGPAANHQPKISRNPSSDSNSSFASSSTGPDSTADEPPSPVSSAAGPSKLKPQSPRIIIPPRGGSRPSSARTPRRLFIPGSPLSSATVRTPGSARSLMSGRGRDSPWSASSPWAISAGATLRSARPFNSARNTPVTPRDDKNPLVPMYVREVTTRTVTWGHAPMAPLAAPPRGKRRKTITQDELRSEGSVKSESPKPEGEDEHHPDAPVKEKSPA